MFQRLRDWGFFTGPPTWDASKDMADQSGRTILITGATAGLGRTSLLPMVRHGARVLLLARDEIKASKTMEDVVRAAKEAGPAVGTEGIGSLDFIPCDLADLTSVRKAASEVQSKTDKLHILYANAGVLGIAKPTAQGHEMTFGVNVLGHFLLIRLLEELLISTAEESEPNSVRAVILASSAHEFGIPSGMTSKWDPSDETKWYGKTTPMYCRSKLGDLHLCLKFSQRWSGKGVACVGVHPGNWQSDLQNSRARLARWLILHLVCRSPENGPLTQLWVGTVKEPETSCKLDGAYIVPWTRFGKSSESARDQLKADLTWEWCQKAAAEFLEPQAAGAG